MKNFSFIFISLLLGAIVLVGCGEWFAKRQNNSKHQTQTAIAEANTATTAKTLDMIGQNSSSPIFSAETPLPPTATQMAARKTILPTDTPSILRSDNPIRGIMGLSGRYENYWHIMGGPRNQVTPETFMEKYLIPALATSKMNELRFESKQKDNRSEYEYWYYRQYHKGLPTVHKLTLVVKDSLAHSFDTTFGDAMDIDTVPTISEQQAWDAVKTFLAITDTKTAFPKKYRGVLDWNTINEFPYPPEIINEMTYQVHLAIEPVNDSNPSKKGEILVYKFKLNNNKYMLNPIVLLDALDGTVVGYGSVNYCSHTATVDTKYGFPTKSYYDQNFCVEIDTNGKYVLEDTVRKITTLKQSGGGGYNYTGTPIVHDTVNWNTHANREYATAHWALQAAYDNFSTKYSYTIGQPIKLFLDCPILAPEALSNYIDNNYAIYFGHDTTYSQDMNSLDVTGHEFSHSIRSQISLNVAYSVKPHATAAEAFCDILGASFEHRLRTIDTLPPYNWIILDDLSTNQKMKRSFKNPHEAGASYINTLGQAAFYNEKGYWEAYLSRYERTGIINHWFYLLTHGTTSNKRPYKDADNDGYADLFPSLSNSVKVFPIDTNLTTAIDTATKIVFDVFKNRLQDTDNFLDIAHKTIISAILKGYACDAIRSVYNAWRAVGIYPNLAVIDSVSGVNFPLTCPSNSNTWDTACNGFTPDYTLQYFCEGSLGSDAYQLIVTDNNGDNGPYTYEIVGTGTFFTPDDALNEFITTPILEDSYTIIITNSNGCEYTTTGLVDNGCPTLSNSCTFDCDIYAEGSICDIDYDAGSGVYLNFLCNIDPTVVQLDITYNGIDWATLGNSALSSNSLTIYFPEYQIGEQIYYIANNTGGCIAQGSFVPLCNGDEPAPNEAPIIAMESHIPICNNADTEICIPYSIIDPEGNYPINIYSSFFILEDPLLPTTIYSTGSSTEPASGEFCVTPSHTLGGLIIHVFDALGAHTFHSVIFDYPIGDFQFISTPACGDTGFGSVTLNIENPGNYTYLWSNGSTTQNLSNVLPGTYYVAISNAECSRYEEVVVEQSDFYVDYYEYCDINTNEFSMDIMSDGQPPFIYTIGGNNFTVEEDFFTTPPLSSDYTIIVSDATGCETTISGHHNCSCPFTADITNTVCTPPDMSFNLSFDCETGPYTYDYIYMGTTVYGNIEAGTSYQSPVFLISQTVPYNFTDFFDNTINMQAMCCQNDLFSVQILNGTANCLAGNAHFWVKTTGQGPFDISAPIGTDYTISVEENENNMFEIGIDNLSSSLINLQIENGAGCLLIFNIPCYDIIGDIDNSAYTLPCPTIDAPIMWHTNIATSEAINADVKTCVGQQVCIDYYVSNLSGINSVLCPTPGFYPGQVPVQGIHTYPGQPIGYYESGQFCWTPTPDDVGTHHIQLLGIGNTPEGCASYSQKMYTITVFALPLVSSWATEVLSPLILDCKGDIYEPAQVQILPQYTPNLSNCPPIYTINGSTIPIATVHGGGEQTIIVNYNNENISIPIVIPVSQLKHDSFVPVAEVTNSSTVCGEDQCTGQVVVWVNDENGGAYTYEWSDGCEWHPYDPIRGRPLSNIPDTGGGGGGGGNGPDCNGAWHGNLCAGTYSVTVTDQQTGCTASIVYNITNGLVVNGEHGGHGTHGTIGGIMEAVQGELQINSTIFTNTTRADFYIPAKSEVRLYIHNASGTLVQTLINGEMYEKGNYTTPQFGNRYRKGMYFVTLEVCNTKYTKKVIKF